MCLAKNKKLIIAVFLFLFVGILTFPYVKAAYLTTNRDTKLPPDKVTYDIVNVDDYELIYETDTLAYYFREDRDVFAIEDKRNGYTWKSGLDIPFGADVNEQILEAETKEEAEKLAIPLEEGMNTTYTGISNSVITVEYLEEGTIKSISSASKDMVESSLVTLNDNKATRRLDVDFQNIEVDVKVHITFLDDSIQYEIKPEDVTGKGKANLVAINITPFLGASGGKTKYYNPETEMYDIIEDKYMVPGYIFVPDGSGSLIRFQDNNASFSMYYGDVYGSDHAQGTYYNNLLTDAIPLKEPVMPVFGVAHGDRQSAFVAYADSGSEYMQIAVRPEENLTAYNYVYPRFVYNVNYWQVYNKKGEGFFSLMNNPNSMDIKMTYTFLAGDGSDGSPAADYTGMAETYREHLIDEGILKEISPDNTSDIPLRLDFMMSDSKKGIVGNEEVVVTTTEDVRDILNTISIEDGIKNINSGLFGWQQGGETFAKPDSNNYSGKIGSRKEFKNLITEFAEKSIDISYGRNFTLINKEMLSYQSNAAKHVNSWYLELNKMIVLPANVPVSLYGYASPKKSAEWFENLYERVKEYSPSMTVSGISNTLISDYNRKGPLTTVTEAIDMYQKAMEKAKGDVKLNMENPNMYLWKYTDRYLKSPVGTSQYVFQTDAVPFLQMVLRGTMEVYGPYSNFSFYTQSDILRMIDYNISPAFILTKKPSYHLSSTSSAELYSTEFDQYEELIKKVYGQVNEALSQVIGYTWTDRIVLENGVIQNTYTKGSETKTIIINYTDENVTYDLKTVAPLSASVISSEEVR
ncbi:MAG: ABC-type transport system, substrate-binding component [Anaerocolumna sp.]|jgi:hypothetical protein|nr:ABC-type transport system, substrate-binding component [Anaerocolumna sp.]